MLAVGYPLRAEAGVVSSATDAQERLQVLKRRVQLARETFGATAWRRAVYQIPPAWGGVAQPISRAYYKMWEIATVCALAPPSGARSLHLCEAPGGFVQACIELVDALDWRAASLCSGPRFSPTLDATRLWADDDGNLLDAAHRDRLVAWARGPEDRTIDVVTADGAADIDHNQIEDSAILLLEAQVDTALRVLGVGGCFVVKFFEGCHVRTRDALWCAARHFEDATILKPSHSRPTNSERYLVCAQRRITPHDEARREAWMSQLARVVEVVCAAQLEALAQALRTVSVI